MGSEVKAAVAIEPWKLDTFKSRLNKADFQFENKGQLLPGVIMLQVHYEQAQQQALAQLVLAAMQECARTGPPNK